jgi:hypothetical protein
VKYEETQLDCPRCDAWVPVERGTVNATCPYCWRLIPVTRSPEPVGVESGLAGLLRAVASGLRRESSRRRIVARYLIHAGLNRRACGLLAEPGMARGREMTLVTDHNGEASADL